MQIHQFQLLAETCHAGTLYNMNSFYRFVGLRVRNVKDDNNEATYSTRWHAENEVREEIWGKRLDKAFAEYGLILEYYGIYPTITDHKGGDDVISTYYYD